MQAMDIKKIMNNQPVLNVGMIGHVSNGKSTIVKALTGKKTQQHSNEQERNITIKLGYANAKIFKCNVCKPPQCYTSAASNIFELKCAHCNNFMELINHISFADCPGHHLLMSTMLNGTCVMDYTILVESLNNENIPAPQTVEHVRATTLTNTPNKIICFNKVDLLKKSDVEKKIKTFKKYASETILENSSIVPIVASIGLNIDVLCEELSKLKIPQYNLNENCKMIVIRSFNANKPGTSIKDLKGGVIGGSLIKGVLSINDDIILKPGFVSKNHNYSEGDENSKRWKCRPIVSKILSIQSESNNLETVIPGGLIGIQLDIDPALTANDGLIGNIVMNKTNEMEYSIFEDIEIQFMPLSNDSLNFKEIGNVSINVNASNRTCQVLRYKKNIMILKMLSNPICAKKNDEVTVSINTNTGEGITIIGKGIILDGNSCEIY